MRTTKAIKTSKRATTSKCYDSLKQYTAGVFLMKENKIGKLNITTTQFIFAEMG